MMSHLPPPNNTPLHCALDWLGKSVVALLMTLGLLYGSAYTIGWPSLPDPDRQWRNVHNTPHGCDRAAEQP